MRLWGYGVMGLWSYGVMELWGKGLWVHHTKQQARFVEGVLQPLLLRRV